MDVRVSWLALDTAAEPCDVRVSWVALDTAATPCDVRVSWLAFDTAASVEPVAPITGGGGLGYPTKARRSAGDFDYAAESNEIAEILTMLAACGVLD